MQPTELTALLHRQPFIPFRLLLTTGESYNVAAPGFLWVQREFADLVTRFNPRNGVVTQTSRLALNTIERTQDLKA